MPQVAPVVLLGATRFDDESGLLHDGYCLTDTA